jgi:glutaminyl-peptide cyclotransferase
MLNLRNIIASFNPEKTKRILLAAHWDTRPVADKDSIRTDTRSMEQMTEPAVLVC